MLREIATNTMKRNSGRGDEERRQDSRNSNTIGIFVGYRLKWMDDNEKVTGALGTNFSKLKWIVVWVKVKRHS